MKKNIIYVSLVLLLIAVVFSVIRLNKTNSTALKTYKTEQAKTRNIVNKVIATGKVVPLEEVDIKPQISGIVEKIFLEEGVKVKKGDLLAQIRVIPNEQSLISASGSIKNLKVNLDNAKTVLNRNKLLFEKGVLSKVNLEQSELMYNQVKQQYRNAQNNYQIIKKGSIGGGRSNTNIRATTSGTLLQLPIEEGDQVVQTNNFNAGTTIASIADMTKMIFEGKVDESEVGKLKIGLPLDITIGALVGEKMTAKLNFIAPKGLEENGAIQFIIKGDLDISNVKQVIRAGYSANASIVVQKKDSVLSIREALVQFDEKTKKPFVEVLKDEDTGTYERKDIETGVSDGIHIEVISGVSKADKIKVWNIESDKDNEDNEY